MRDHLLRAGPRRLVFLGSLRSQFWLLVTGNSLFFVYSLIFVFNLNPFPFSARLGLRGALFEADAPAGVDCAG